MFAITPTSGRRRKIREVDANPKEEEKNHADVVLLRASRKSRERGNKMR